MYISWLHVLRNDRRGHSHRRGRITHGGVKTGPHLFRNVFWGCLFGFFGLSIWKHCGKSHCSIFPVCVDLNFLCAFFFSFFFELVLLVGCFFYIPVDVTHCWPYLLSIKKKVSSFTVHNHSRTVKFSKSSDQCNLSSQLLESITHNSCLSLWHIYWKVKTL